MTPSNRIVMYSIRIEGQIDARWLSNFEDLMIAQPNDTETEIRGKLDQAGLHGVFNRIRDLGLDIISVERLMESKAERTEP